MGKDTDIQVRGATLYFLPVETRVPLKFGPETLTHVTCARVQFQVDDRRGGRHGGWGETPLSVQWVWPGTLAYEERHRALMDFCRRLVEAWTDFAVWGHPMEIGHAFQEQVLPDLLRAFNQERAAPMPWLAALVCCSAFDLALHDAYGQAHQTPVFQTYNNQFMNADLAYFIQPAAGSDTAFNGRFPSDFLVQPAPKRLPACHLVGGMDLLHADELHGSEP